MPYLWIVVCYFVSRALYYAVGVRFETKYIAANFQFLDLALLKGRLWETLYYSHVQPPLMNAITGLFLKLFDNGYGTAFHVFHMVLGAGSSMLLYKIMLDLAVGPRIAFALTLAFMASPGCILWENYPLYEYEIMFLLLLSGLLIFRLFRQPSLFGSFLFFSALATLGWIRSIYHPYLLAIFAAVFCVFLKHARSQVLAGAAIPFASLMALYFKNLVVFGFFGCSSWLGANMVVMTAHNLNPEDKAQLIRAGQLPQIARMEPGDAVAEYRRVLPPVLATGIPILDEDVKQLGGGVNTNSMVYLRADQPNRAVAKQVLRIRPGAYLQAVAIAAFCYFLPPSDFFHFEENRAAIRWLERPMNVLVYGQFLETTRKGLRELKAQGAGAKLILYTGSFLIVMVPLLLAWGVFAAWTGWRTGSLNRPQLALLLYLLFHILFVMGTTTLLSSFENNRYRFPTDPLYVVLFSMLLTRRRLKSASDVS